jgi:hypothetical protein
MTSIHTSSRSLATAQIGASGVLLIQYQLLKHGIESALMTTDAGIDLVVYSPHSKRAITVQVKTCLRPKPAGGKGKMTLDWYLPEDTPAELIGVVNLEKDEVWLFTRDEFVRKAQQHNGGRAHLYFYVDPEYTPSDPESHVRRFEEFRIERRIPEFFGLPPVAPVSFVSAP